jgi:ABC-2 type transport system permease protein
MRTEAPLPRARGLLHGVGAFSLTELRVQLHESVAILTSMITQVVVLIFVAILAPHLIAIALMGAILFSMFTLGQRVLNEAAYVRVDHKLNELYLASPLAPGAYFVGIAVGVLIAYLAPILILVAVALVVIPFTPLLAVTLFLGALAVWLFSSAMGYVLSTLFKDMRAIWSYASILYNLFGVLPPVFYPVTLFPAVLRPIALTLPPSAAAALAQTALHPGILTPGEVAYAIGALVVASSAMFLFALYWARRTVQER